MTTRKAQITGSEYMGKRSKTGNSLGFRFEGALFKSHPEFNGQVRARVIAPGRMLVVAEGMGEQETDLMMASFLAFLQDDVLKKPETLRALDAGLLHEIGSLVECVPVVSEEDLGDEELL